MQEDCAMTHWKIDLLRFGTHLKEKSKYLNELFDEMTQVKKYYNF